MNKKNEISSILNSCNNLFEIFNYHLAKTPHKKVFLRKRKFGIRAILLKHQKE